MEASQIMDIANFLNVIIQMYIYVIFAFVVMSWLLSFNFISLRSPIWSRIWDILTSLTNPIFGPLRRFIPPLGGLDVTPIVVLLTLSIIQGMLH